MELRLDLSKSYGIVLEGGGAKGAYQIGAWKALKEANISISAVSGVSVGALNGAMIVMDKLEKAMQIWEHITYSDVINVEDTLVDAVFHGKMKYENLTTVVKDGWKVLMSGGFDITPLKELIKANIDEEQIRRSQIQFFLTTYSITNHKLLNININEIEEGQLCEMLLASAYLPVFKNEPLHGERFTDGGGWNLVPTDALIDAGYKDIIVIRIYGIGHQRKIEIPEDVTVYEIAPRYHLGGVLGFDAKQSKKNLKLGYYDMKRFLYGLEGIHYYFDCQMTEEQCYEEIVRKIREQNGELSLRTINERIIPQIAEKVKNKKMSTYRELYIKLLELSGKELKITKYNIYTEQEFLTKIREVLEREDKTEQELEIVQSIREIVKKYTE